MHLKLTQIKSFLSNFFKEKDISLAVDNLFYKFNKPVVTKKHLLNWIMQFSPCDRAIAIKLVNIIDYNSYPDIMHKLTVMHGKLSILLSDDGFDSETFSDVDFTKAYTCKSGDLISYMYRKANKIRNVNFKTVETLQLQSKEFNSKRAIVTLDDYTGTGDQFLSEFYARNPANLELLNSYKKIYFMPIVANMNAVEKFEMLKQGKITEVTNKILQEFALNHTDGRLYSALSLVQKDKLTLLTHNIEYPLLSQNNKLLSEKNKKYLEGFLLKYNCGSPFGMGNAQGHTTFFYNAPNSLPDVLWNSKMKQYGIVPLFSRTNDISIYPMAADVPFGEQVW